MYEHVRVDTRGGSRRGDISLLCIIGVVEERIMSKEGKVGNI